MESLPSTTSCEFLAKPVLASSDMPYVVGSKKIYANLFKVVTGKDMKLYQYPIAFEPPIAEEDRRMKAALFNMISTKVKEVYGECFQSGDLIYCTNSVSVLNQFAFVNPRTQIEYVLKVLPQSNVIEPNPEYINTDQLTKQCLELLFRDIFRANPNLEFYRNLMIMKNEKQTVSSNRNSFDFYPGYSTSLIYTALGTYLNVSIKNKILSTMTCLEIINTMRTKGKRIPQEEEEIKDHFIRRSIKTSYSNKNYIVDDVTFDKNPQTCTVNKDGHNLSLLNYYKVAHSVEIKDKTQPLLVVNRSGSQGEVVTLYFVPELCQLGGIDDSVTRDGQFMKNLATYTKLTPVERVEKTNEFLDLMQDKNEKVLSDKKTKVNLVKEKSAYAKKQMYQLDVLPATKNTFEALYMQEPTLNGLKSKITPNEKKPFLVTKGNNLTKWLCIYHKQDYSGAESLNSSLQNACKAYGLSVSDPEWVEMESKYAEDWVATVEDYRKTNKYQVVVFLLDRTLDRLYKDLKIHSLCTMGYISQVVKIESLQKNALSVCSKLLLQINYKLGGSSYNIKFGKDVTSQRLMIVGVDSSHVSGKRTGVAMVASVSADFTQYHNKIDLIKEVNKEQLVFCVSGFLREAINVYFKNNKCLPSGIIIYRQGVSRQQKEFLKSEVQEIEKLLTGADDEKVFKDNPIPYYYILVNTKTTLKFFEIFAPKRNVTDYKNPDTGLLVIDGVTDPGFFEFYIQPQEVTGGTATPTCYHVAFGNMQLPAFIPKFTFDLCFLYANWPGPVRVPSVLKSAEKLSKMTAKYTKAELHKNLTNSLAYL